jgi:putative endonuclease
VLTTSPRQALGKLGESLAQDELRRRGYAISATNFRTRFGEIDIICERDNVVVFVEVKARRTNLRGSAAESIPIWKRRRIGAMALDYLAVRGALARRFRFDVVAIDRAGTAQQTIRVIEDAFRPGDWR